MTKRLVIECSDDVAEKLELEAAAMGLTPVELLRRGAALIIMTKAVEAEIGAHLDVEPSAIASFAVLIAAKASDEGQSRFFQVDMTATSTATPPFIAEIQPPFEC